jgi:hypothetical protein
MLAVATPLKDRLAALPALAGWDVRTGTDLVDRRVFPAVDLRCRGAQSQPTRNTAAMVAPEWSVVLMVRRGPGAADALDAAMADVIESLHNWLPSTPVAGRRWEPLRLVGALEAEFADEGIAGYALSFTTQALYQGQP